MGTDIFFVDKIIPAEILSLEKAVPGVWHNVRQAQSGIFQIIKV
jgi:hypothetical protein